MEGLIFGILRYTSMFVKFEQNLWVRFDVFWDDILMVRNIVVSKFAFFDYFNRFLSNR